MTKCWDLVTESACRYIQDANFSSLPEKPEPVKSPKKFIFHCITDSEDALRKSILWQIQDLKFEKSRSRLNSNIYFCFDYKLPGNANLQKQIAIIVRLDPKGFFSDKCDQDLHFIVLNNEMELRHRSSGVPLQLLKAGDRLQVPTNKRFYLCNNDVDSSHILLLMQPSLKLPLFLGSGISSPT